MNSFLQRRSEGRGEGIDRLKGLNGRDGSWRDYILMGGAIMAEVDLPYIEVDFALRPQSAFEV